MITQKLLVFIKMRKHVLSEICETERRYISSMRELKRLFYDPISEFVPLDEVQTVLFPWIGQC